MRLAPGQACAACLSREAWSHWQAKGVLVIDRATIEASEARRAGTHRRRILGIATSAAATLVSLGLATACVWAVAALFAPRGIGSPAVIVASIRDSGWRVVAWGSACAGLSAGALRLSAPGRLRAIFTAARLGGVVGGSAAALLGGLVLYVAKDAWSIDYLSMPARVDWGEVGEAVQRARDAVAVVVAPDADGDARAGALGAAAVVGVDADRVFLLTCSHVAMPYVAVGARRDPAAAHAVWVQLADGREASGKVVWTSEPPLDVALIQVRLEAPPAAVPMIASSRDIDTGAPVFFLPNPLRHGFRLERGHVLRRELHVTPAGPYSLLYTDLPVRPGDSGSGLFDARGRLVGLNTWTRVSDGAPQGISLPAEAIDEIARAMSNSTAQAAGEPPSREEAP